MAARPSLGHGRKRTAGGSFAQQGAAFKRGRSAPWVPRAMGRGRRATNGTPGAELKFHDIDWDEAAADQSAGVISNASSLVLIGQGITESTRIGRKAVIKSIGWRGNFNLAESAGTTLSVAMTTRLLLVLDTQCNGAAPTVTGDNGLLASANYQSFNDLTNKGRFRVLMDKVFVLNPQASAGNGTANDTANAQTNFSFFKKVDIPIEYSGTANPSIIDEVRTNNIFGILITDTANTEISLDSKFRFRFSDS